MENKASRYPFSKTSAVPFYDCDMRGRLKVSPALRYIQQAATDQLDGMGLTHPALKSEGVVFVLAALALVVRRMPRAGETLLISTCPVATAGAQMLRETAVEEAESGEALLECQTAWAIIDPESGRLLRPSAFRHELPRLEGWSPTVNPAKIRIPDGVDPAGERAVRFSDLDLNDHMNNTVYADILTDCFPEQMREREIGTLLLRYRSQARLGEVMALSTGRKDGVFWASAAIEGRRCFEGSVTFR